jgi:hypothetical protein
MAVNWKAGAELHKSSVSEHVPGKYTAHKAVKVWEGTLDGAVRQYLRKPLSERMHYNIFTDTDPGIGKDILDWHDIDALARDPSFPRFAS